MSVNEEPSTFPPQGRPPAEASIDTAERGESPPASTGAVPDEPGRQPILDDSVTEQYLTRWRDAQSRFVDDPQQAVSLADQLVDDLTKDIAARYRSHTDEATSGASPQSDATETLRLAFQRYRSLFSRLLDA